MLDNAAATATGHHIFSSDPQTMSNEEVGVTTTALQAVMAPMKDENGKYLPNFADCYGVGEEEMTPTQEALTTSMIALGCAGQPAAALAMREAQTNLIRLGEKTNELEGQDDLTQVVDNTAEYEAINKDVKKEQERIDNIVKAYKPLCTKIGVGLASSLYQKHEENIARKEAIREWNVQEVCKGTINAMEESKRESERLMHDTLYGPHGLLRA